MRRATRIGLVTFLLGGTLAALWLVRQEAESGQSLPPSDDRASGAIPRATKATPAHPVSKNAPFPLSTLPVVLEDLRSRAESGDHIAGCQLGAQLLICSSAAQLADGRLIAALKEWEEEAMRAGNTREANDYRVKRKHSIALARECEGVPGSSEHMGYHYLRDAALAGNADAILLHATGGGLGTSMKEGMAYMRDGRFDQWRSEAPGMLQRQLESGDPGALIALIKGYSGPGKLGWILPPDPDRALALSELAQLLFEPPGHAPHAGMDPNPSRERFRRAHLQAKAWHAQYFDGLKVPAVPHLARVAPPRINLQTHQAPAVSCTSGEAAP